MLILDQSGGDTLAQKHPKFRSSPIVEALCEIHFFPRPDREWTSTRPMPLYRALEDQFPQIQLFPEGSLQLTIGPKGAEQNVRQTGQRMQLSSADGLSLVQVPSTGEAIILNVLAPYPGWEAFRDTLLKVWLAASAVLLPETVRRVGLRYINRISHAGDEERLSDWLVPTASIPASLVRSAGPSLAHIELRLDESHRMIENVQQMLPQAAPPHGATILDIDRIWEGQHGNSHEFLKDLVERLHEDVWAEFSSSLSDKLKIKLNEASGP